LTDSIFGVAFLDAGVAKLLGSRNRAVSAIGRAMDTIRRQPPERRTAAVVAAFAGLLFIPYLGAVGLWDCWETHYGEVARSMVQRNDYVYPYWESAWFFSKPPLTMWIQALGMQLVGTNRTDGALALYTEWGMRLPFTLWFILALSLLCYALCRLVSRRVALATGFILATMPLCFLLTRQTVTDTPLVCAMTCALACGLIGQLDEKTAHRSAWWYAFYFFCGLATLAKESLGIVVFAIFGLYLLLTQAPSDANGWEEHLRWLLSATFRAETRSAQRPMPALWRQFYKMRLGTGLLVFAAVGLPWYAVMLLTANGVDEEGKSFLGRLIHDNFNRLAFGVHTTTPGGTFIYYVEQAGYAVFPWVAVLPGGLGLAGKLRFRSSSAGDQVGILASVWSAGLFVLFALSATKFHHYLFPVLPALAILMALFIDRLWEEGIGEHGVSLLFGLILFVLVAKDLSNNPKNFTDLFVYNYERPYPFELVQRPILIFGSRTLTGGDVLALVMIAAGGYLLLETVAAKKPAVLPRAMALLVGLGGAAVLVSTVARGRLPPMFFVGVALALVALYLAWEAGRSEREQKPLMLLVGATLGVGGLAFATYGLRNGARLDPLLPSLLQGMNVKSALAFAFAVAGTACVVAALIRARTMLFGSFWALAFAFALWFNWSHWVSLSHHWTQRDLFWRYYAQRKPDEPIAAFMMNWRGETFYSKNAVKQIKDNAKMTQYGALPGRKWALVEHNRLQFLKNAVGQEKTVRAIDRDLNNKFVLVTID
ncbi:MAG TPA: glycosyltransferase family 39 protein, partial [Myxococcaceae bacterium]|nr:glycosyltransferase family 39 protein [Myxococcaceae bacterium]